MTTSTCTLGRATEYITIPCNKQLLGLHLRFKNYSVFNFNATIPTVRENRQKDRKFGQVTHHVDRCANEDAVVERPEEGNEETNEPRHQINPFKI